MTVLVWDQTGEKHYETGVSNGVLYVRDASGTYPTGVAWSGLMSVAEKPEGADETPFYADNIKYLSLYGIEEFKATIEAYMSPPEFDQCDGQASLATGLIAGQQTRKPFGLVYKTVIGNDVDGDSHGYKLHLIYNAMAQPSERSYNTINDSPEAITLSWELTTSPETLTGYKPTALLTVDSTLADPTKLQALEDELFGTAVITANLPLPDEVVTLLA